MLPGSILQKLHDSHRSVRSPHRSPQPTQRPLNFGVYYKNTLVALCHALEDAILHADYQPLMITAFQRGKWYLEEAERYGEIADRSRQIAIMAASESGFAEHPTSQRSNVALVHLDPGDPVAQEWHLIILSPTYTAMVLCQELSEADYAVAGVPQADLERKFYGFWTFEPNLVLETVDLAIEHIGQYDPALQSQLIMQRQAIVDRMTVEATAMPAAEHLSEVVERVVDYLQTRQQDLDFTLSDALDVNLLSNELQAFLRVSQLMDQTDLSNPLAAAEVASLAEAMGQLLDLPAWQLHRLRLAGLLHRMAFLQHPDLLLTTGTSVQQYAESPDQPPACPLIPGIQALRKMPRLRAIATILMHQSEWWNGAGQPAGLCGDEIPIESRILALLADFQARLAQLRSTQPNLSPEAMLSQALTDCEATAADRWDPKVLDTLKLLVVALQQGVSVPVTLPKIAAGLWLLDHPEAAVAAGSSLSKSTSSDAPSESDSPLAARG
ncbi:MAG: metal-dependent phosphohydrolase [Elainella sp. Prado103]|jgi:DICT domain-containing protein|nr:metal-dependent phosphohydrolase [Elainella sp. Prado103]